MTLGLPTISNCILRLALAAVLTFICATGTAFADKPKPVGTISISAKQISFLVSGQRGGGTLRFKGKSFQFKIGGLGVGGIGVAKLVARGEVYDLKKASDFYGPYGAARIGWAIGDASSGQMWLKNQRGVILHLWTDREGLMLSMGADVIQISPK